MREEVRLRREKILVIGVMKGILKLFWFVVFKEIEVIRFLVFCVFISTYIYF